MGATTLHGSTKADLIAIPAIVLGFHPQESCVVMGLQGRRVEFCARLEMDWPEYDFAPVSEQLLNACDNFEDCQVVVIGYTSDVLCARPALEAVLDVLNEQVMLVLVTDGQRYWELTEIALEPPEGIPSSFASSQVAAQAVYQGISICSSRNQLISEVLPPLPGQTAQVRERYLVAEMKTAELNDLGRLSRLAELLEGEPISEAQGAELACLLQEPLIFGEVLTRLRTATAPAYHPKLLRARANCDEAHAANPVAILALSCWLTGKSAQLSECLRQLIKLAPEHPILSLLDRMQSLAVEPKHWDD